MINEFETQINGVTLFSRTIGNGKPLLFLHGNGEDGTIFLKAAHRLSSRFAVHLIDSRGHGKSSSVPHLSYAEMAEDIYAYICHHALESVAICGFSDGGIIALLLTAAHPDAVSKLIVCGANTSRRGYTLPFRIWLRLASIFKNSEYIRLMREMPDIEPDVLHSIVSPTLVLAGTRDVITQEHTRSLAAALPNAECRILLGETHFSYVQNADKLCPLLQAFLE